MVIEGSIELPQSSVFSAHLKALSQHYMDMAPPALSAEQIERQRYALTDMLDDIHEPLSEESSQIQRWHRSALE